MTQPSLPLFRLFPPYTQERFHIMHAVGMIRQKRKYKRQSVIWSLFVWILQKKSFHGLHAMEPVLCVIKHTFLHQFAGHLSISHLLRAALPFQEAAFLRDEKSRLWHGGEFVLLLQAVLFALCNLYRFPQTTRSSYIWFLLNGKTLFLFHIDLCEERTDIRPIFQQLGKKKTQPVTNL